MMQPCSKEMRGVPPIMSLQEFQKNQLQQSQHMQNPQIPVQSSHFDNSSSTDDFFEQMLSSYPSWSDNSKQFFNASMLSQNQVEEQAQQNESLYQTGYDEPTLLTSQFRQNHIDANHSTTNKSVVAAQQHLLQRAGMAKPPPLTGTGGCLGSCESEFLPLPLTLGNPDAISTAQLDVESSFGSHNCAGEGTAPDLYGGFSGTLQPACQNASMGSQNFTAAAGTGMNQAATGTATTGTPVPRQRVRARRGQATDPHSIAERLRRERIAERMKALQELVPNANKTDKASMLDEIIEYVKFLQLQVKVLSMSRLGGAAAVAPLVGDISSEACGIGLGGNVNTTSVVDDSLVATEHQVAKLMEEDMGAALQYLQGKGLCLMPISLASAISSATRNPNLLIGPNIDAPSSPSISVLTVQSVIANGVEASVKDATSVSKP